MSTKIHHSFKYAAEGIAHSIRGNLNFKIHILIGLFIFILSLLLGLSKTEIIIVMTMITLVISAEMVNTAIEEMTNLIISQHHVQAKISKDVAAGMVLLVSILAAVVGVAIFYPYIF